jgi:hypothetical protein
VAGHQYPSSRATNLGQEDLHYMRAILVTAGMEMSPERGLPAGWNLNDDFFDATEAWMARHTPEDKPLNYEHDDNDIIGHITDDLVMAADGAVLPDDLVVDELPGKFHIVTHGVIYKHRTDPQKQARIDQLLDEMAQGKWAVSMEATFKGFDYVLASSSRARVIARGEKTAFLTKYLRAYGGSGQYQGERIGRLLRNLVFCGKGMVRSPANPESVVLAGKSVYVPVTSEQTGGPTMTVEYEALQKQLEATVAELESLRADSKSALDSVIAERDKLRDDLATVVAERAKLSEDLVATQVSLARSQEELTGLRQDVQRANRTTMVKDQLGLEGPLAATFVDNTMALSDEAFAAQLTVMVQAVQSQKTMNAPTPTQSTPAPLPGQSTNFPTVGDCSKDKQKASLDVLNRIEEEPSPAGAVQSQDGVEGLRLAIAKCFGWKPEE